MYLIRTFSGFVMEINGTREIEFDLEFFLVRTHFMVIEKDWKYSGKYAQEKKRNVPSQRQRHTHLHCKRSQKRRKEEECKL